jgi:hypothetical protein
VKTVEKASLDTFEKSKLVPQTMLFGKVVVYECTACSKTFAMPLLEGAVSEDLPAPSIVHALFLDHECNRSNSKNSESK